MEKNSSNGDNNSVSNDDNNKRIKRKKTATIPFRIDSEYEQLLRSEADEKK